MSSVRIIRRWAACGALVLTLAGGLHAAPAPLAAFLSARQGLSVPAAAPTLLASAQTDPAAFAGRVFELPATVCGLIEDDGQQTVLLSVDGGGPTLAAHLPAPLRGASWIDSGARLRALVLVERTGNEQSLSNLRLVSAAPEGDVAEADREEAARLAERQAARARVQAAQWARGVRGRVPLHAVPAAGVVTGGDGRERRAPDCPPVPRRPARLRPLPERRRPPEPAPVGPRGGHDHHQRPVLQRA